MLVWLITMSWLVPLLHLPFWLGLAGILLIFKAESLKKRSKKILRMISVILKVKGNCSLEELMWFFTFNGEWTTIWRRRPVMILVLKKKINAQPLCCILSTNAWFSQTWRLQCFHHCTYIYIKGNELAEGFLTSAVKLSGLIFHLSIFT